MIRESARAVNDLPTWGEIDLVLSQFGFNLWPEYGEDYVFRVLRDGSDDDLVELHQHLFPDDSPLPNATPPPASEAIWQPAQLRLFMSHIAADKLIISELKQRLARWHIDAFVAHEDIEPTREWLAEIETALRTCHALLAYLTPAFHESKYTDHEVGFCVARGVPIISVKCGTDPYGFFAKYQALRGLDVPPEKLADQIAATLAAHQATSALMAEPLVAALEGSRSYDRTRSIMSVIEGATGWTAEQLRRMQHAAVENSQVRECVMPYKSAGGFMPVPDRIQEIVARR
jgi:hypothetical protein